MPSSITRPKRAPLASTAVPFARLVIADEFRVEQSGKVMGLGLYPDSVVVMQIPKGSPQPTKSVPYGINVLSLLVTVGGVSGTVPVSITLGDMPPVLQTVELANGSSANLIFGLRPFLVRSFGVKTVKVELAGREFVFTYEVRGLETDGAIPSLVTVPQPIKPGTKTRKTPRAGAKRSTGAPKASPVR